MTDEKDREKELSEFSKLTNDVHKLIAFCTQMKNEKAMLMEAYVEIEQAFKELSDSYSILKLENLKLTQKM